MEENKKPQQLKPHQSIDAKLLQKKPLSSQQSSQAKPLYPTQTPCSITSKLSYFMIKVTLTSTFNYKQFKLITSIPSHQWITSQLDLWKRLRQNPKLYDKYFDLFYKNHVVIANWYQLATREKTEIEPYVFRELLDHQKLANQKKRHTVVTLQQQGNFHNQRVKESFHDKNQNKKKSIEVAGDRQESPLKSLKINTMTSPKGKQNAFGADGVNMRNSMMSEGGFSDSNNFNESENMSFMKPTFMPIGLRRYNNPSQPLRPSTQPPQPLPTDPSPTTNPKSPTPISLTKQKQQLMGVFFNNMIELNQLQHKRKPLNLKLYKLKRKETIDQHDLYIKTFDACNGRKYIFYDYEKHMKGLKEKGKYNMYLRNGVVEASVEQYLKKERSSNQQHLQSTSKNLHQPLTTSDPPAPNNPTEPPHQPHPPQKFSLLPMNLVLNQKKLNNYQGLKKIVNQNKSSKVVFVNHQGKPITYYIKHQQKKVEKGGERLRKSCSGSGVGKRAKGEGPIEGVGNSVTIR